MIFSYCWKTFQVIVNIQLQMDWVNPLVKVNNKFKFQLFGRAYENLLHFYAAIPKYDPEKRGGLSEHAFNLLLNASGVFFTTQEIRTIKDQFPHQCGINYFMFVGNVRNDYSQKRLAAIDHTFDQFQKDGKVSVATLISSIRIDQHPHVRSLSKKPERAQFDVEEGLKYWSGDGVSLTHQEFTQYCKDVNATIPLQREEFFIDLLIHTFGLFQSGISFDRIQQLEVTIYEKIRQKTEIKKDEGLKSSSCFKFLDLESKGLMDYKTFVGVLERVGCKFTDNECKAVFYKHSHGSNLLDYQQVCGLFFHMSSGVKENPNIVFEMASSSQGHITTPGMTRRLH